MDVKKYKYNQNQNVKTTMDITEITPIYWNKLYPGETFKSLTFKNLTRMIPPLYPTLDNPKISLYAFAVPKRILVHEKNDAVSAIWSTDIFLSSTNNNSVAAFWNKQTAPTPEQKKYMDDLINPSAYVSNSNLMEKFGIKNSGHIFNTGTPSNLQTGNFNLMYNLAYWKIYEQFFKEKQLEHFNYWDLYNALTENGKNNVIYSTTLTGDNADRKREAALKVLNSLAVVNTDNDFINSFRYNTVDIQASVQGLSGGVGAVKFPEYFSFEQFKNSVYSLYVRRKKVIDKIETGTLKDTILSVWNTNNGDKTSPVLLGYEDFQQTITQITNQSKTKSEYLGEVGGMSMTYNKGSLINDYTVNEETYIMVLAVPNYKVNFNGVYEFAEFNHINTKLPGAKYSGIIGGLYDNFTNDKFNPGMEVAFAPVLDGIFSGITRTENSLGTLAYEPAFNYLRNKKDIVAGEVMDTTKWGTWTYSREFTSIPSDLGLNYVKATKKPFKDTLINPEGDSFISEFNFNTSILRVIKPEQAILEDLAEGNL